MDKRSIAVYNKMPKCDKIKCYARPGMTMEQNMSVTRFK